VDRGGAEQVLLPMQEQCLEVLKTISMADTVNAAAAMCPLPTAPCTTYPEFTAYSQVSARQLRSSFSNLRQPSRPRHPHANSRT
jgi:hypothetical protein